MATSPQIVITWADAESGHRHVCTLDEFVLFPATHYSASDDRLRTAVTRIEAELQDRIDNWYSEKGPVLWA